MKYLKLGSSNLNASVVGMGCWAIGGGASWGSYVNDELAIATIEKAFDSGINFFDTAPVYGWGHSEQLLGRVIQGRRDQFLIATKCGLWSDDQRGSYFADFEGRPIHRSLRPDNETKFSFAQHLEPTRNDKSRTKKPKFWNTYPKILL